MNAPKHKPDAGAPAAHARPAHERLGADPAAAPEARQVQQAAGRAALRSKRATAPVLAAALVIVAAAFWLLASASGLGRAAAPWLIAVMLLAPIDVLLSRRAAADPGRRGAQLHLLGSWPCAAVIGAGSAWLAGAAPGLAVALALGLAALCAIALATATPARWPLPGFVALCTVPLALARLLFGPGPADPVGLGLLACTAMLCTAHLVLSGVVRDEILEAVSQRLRLERLQRDNETLTADRAALATESRTDALTGLSNRRHFEEALASEWNRCRRARLPLSCILLDIDHFKRFNDHYGHDGGDRALRRLGDVLSGAIRRAGDLLARYGGEEFIVLLPNTDRQGAETVAAQLQHAIRGAEIPHQSSPTASHLTCSMGVSSLVPDTSGDPAQLFKAADLALYEAKRGGRDRIVHADAATLESARLAARGLIG